MVLLNSFWDARHTFDLFGILKMHFKYVIGLCSILFRAADRPSLLILPKEVLHQCSDLEPEGQ